jgi:uncharacterized protein
VAKRAVIVVAVLVSLVGLALAAETPIPPAPTRWVTDPTALLTPATRSKLDARLESYERATHHQVIVWIGTTLGGAPVEEWAANAFRAWGIGRKGEDDGVAIFIFRADRALRIEVGYGVEDRLPDAYASQIVRDVMTPALRANQPDAAVTGAVDQVLSRLGGEPNGVVVPPLADSTKRPARAPSPVSIIFGIIGLIALLVFAITHPRLALFMLWTIVSRGAGGGFGGGSGFSGRGGRSGGGGASGSW